MKDNNPILNKQNKAGFTLVEVIVSMTLLVIVAGILLTGVMSSSAINSRSTDLTNEGYRIAALLEEKEDGNEDEVLISVNGQNIMVSGLLLSEDNEAGVGFTMFVPDLTNSGANPDGGILIGGNSEYAIDPWPSLGDYYSEVGGGNGNVRVVKGTIFEEKGIHYIAAKSRNLRKPGDQTQIDKYMEGNEDGPFAIPINMQTDLESPSVLSPRGDMEAGDILKIVEGSEVKIYAFYPYKEYEDDWDDDGREEWEEDWEEEWEDALEKASDMRKFLRDFFVEITFHNLNEL